MPAPIFRSLRSHPGRAVALGLAALVSAGAVVAALGGGASPETPGGGVRHASPAPAADGMPDKAAVPAAGGGRREADRSTGAPLVPTDADAEKMIRQPAAPTPGASGVPGVPGGGPESLGGPPLPQAVAAGTSRIVKTAAVDLKVDKGKLAGVEQQALDTVAAAGGWVQSSDMGAEAAHLVLKVPSDRLEGVVSSLKKLGKVRSESMAGEDVTAQFVDLEARLRHWKAQESVFLGLMARAKTIPETIQIQQQLSQIQEQIEQLEGQRRYLDGQTTFSTIRLGLVEEGAVAKQPEEATPSTLARAWERAAGAALAVLGGTLVVLGAAVPLALVLGIPALVVLAALRRRSGVIVPPV
jgi:hypothetical protein